MAASINLTGNSWLLILPRLIIMSGAARCVKTVFRRLGHPGAVGNMAAGLLPGPSLAGNVFPQTCPAA